MAIHQSAAVLANNAYKSLGVFVRTFEVPVTTDMIDNADDVIECLPVFAGETVLGVQVVATDLAASALEVGDGAATGRYIALADGTVGVGGGRVEDTIGVPYQYAADDTIDVNITTAGVTPAAGTLTVTAWYQAA